MKKVTFILAIMLIVFVLTAYAVQGSSTKENVIKSYKKEQYFTGRILNEEDDTLNKENNTTDEKQENTIEDSTTTIQNNYSNTDSKFIESNRLISSYRNNRNKCRNSCINNIWI